MTSPLSSSYDLTTVALNNNIRHGFEVERFPSIQYKKLTGELISSNWQMK
jgi:hypothetical protein